MGTSGVSGLSSGISFNSKPIKSNVIHRKAKSLSLEVSKTQNPTNSEAPNNFNNQPVKRRASEGSFWSLENFTGAIKDIGKLITTPPPPSQLNSTQSHPETIDINNKDADLYKKNKELEKFYIKQKEE
jgi:hypothetical protein